MQPAFAVGTVLRDRYVIQSILGQGGMGRTYKAIDKERFDEPCVIKEFMPPNDSPTVVAKARELFQREASTLYQISHPQVPQFRAAFEMSGRLFLVQDYVEGKNFRDLLQEHGAFDEGTILQLLLEVLPILSYLHSRGIIHRDISPENLMLRAKDNLPVLIDFGVVQAAQMGLPPSTIAGKPGYAPPEQLQSGSAYASSDLYALAVTAVVLLTDREPSELFDHRSLTWEWHEYAQVSDSLRQILDKMLAYKPAHRYSSADEVLEAIQLLEASRSQVRTYAVNVQPLHTNLSKGAGDRTSEVQHTIYADISGKPTRKPWILRFNWLWAILLVILSGIGSWAITSILFDQGRRITPDPTPTPTLTAPSPSATIIPNINRNLELLPTDREGQQRATATGKILEKQSITFRLSLEKGQTVTIFLIPPSGDGLLLTVNSPSLRPISEQAVKIPFGYWQGKITESGMYLIVLELAAGVKEANYNLEVVVNTPKAPPTPTPTATPTPTPTSRQPVVVPRVLEIAGGEGTVQGNVNANEIIEYSLSLAAGQNLSLAVEGNVQLTLYAPDSSLLWNTAGSSQQVFSTTDGTYKIRITTDKQELETFQIYAVVK
jgi:serine/threonine protein kinase